MYEFIQYHLYIYIQSEHAPIDLDDVLHTKSMCLYKPDCMNSYRSIDLLSTYEFENRLEDAANSGCVEIYTKSMNRKVLMNLRSG